MLRIDVKKKQQNYAEIVLVTLEGQSFDLVYSTVGIIDTKTDKKYETFESFLREHSPKYIELFNKKLVAKLEALQQ